MTLTNKSNVEPSPCMRADSNNYTEKTSHNGLDRYDSASTKPVMCAQENLPLQHMCNIINMIVTLIN